MERFWSSIEYQFWENGQQSEELEFLIHRMPGV